MTMDILEKYNLTIWPSPVPHVDREDAKLYLGQSLYARFIQAVPQMAGKAEIDPDLLRRFLRGLTNR